MEKIFVYLLVKKISQNNNYNVYKYVLTNQAKNSCNYAFTSAYASTITHLPQTG